ncbi:MAG: response regulator transcription factor [Deferribacteres bacterium]|nr:response regulator transcription factor [candidate division KSB1 bacterium]MCB9503387.1 response regulator transcription factor [Deferribacteres bacterium]
MAKKILIVDDEEDIVQLLQFNLQKEGYEIFSANDGLTALDLAQSQKPDLVLLDVMLPELDGYDIIRELRKNPATEHIAVIFLTAKDSEFDEVLGLELGADDYIVKPIRMRTLVARIKAVLRKSSTKDAAEEENIHLGDIEIETLNYRVKKQGEVIHLTRKEFEILLFLATRPGRVITRETLLNAIWGDDIVVVDRTIDVHIRKIRDKLGIASDGLIETIKGVGYRLKNE